MTAGRTASARGGARLYKAVASGNDFLVVTQREADGCAWTAEDARLLCRRRGSLGADGLIVLTAGDGEAEAAFELWNADGSRAAVSGNGARCAARVLQAAGLAPRGRVRLRTAEGVMTCHLSPTGVEVDLPAPRDLRRGLTLPPGSPAERGDHVVVGVPYLTLAVPEPDRLELATVAPPLRHWKELPEGANVAFHRPTADVRGPVLLRTWERGVEGETPSSGTGAAAVAISVVLAHGAADGEHVVELAPRAREPLTVTVTIAGGRPGALRLSGPARVVAEILPAPDAWTGPS